MFYQKEEHQNTVLSNLHLLSYNRFPSQIFNNTKQKMERIIKER